MERAALNIQYSSSFTPLTMLARLANAFRRKQWSYDLLPTSEWASAHGAAHAQPPRWRVWRRCGFTVLFSMFMGIAMSIALLVFVILSPWIWRTKVLASIFGPKPLPPLYPEFKKAELALPQHHVKDPFAAGQKYLWVASHVSCKQGFGRRRYQPFNDDFQGLAGAISCKIWF